MNRIEIEVKLNQDRARRLEILAEMTEEDLAAPRTRSEHDPSKTWSYFDHFIHTTLIERNWNEMFRRHVAGSQKNRQPNHEDPWTSSSVSASR